MSFFIQVIIAAAAGATLAESTGRGTAFMIFIVCAVALGIAIVALMVGSSASSSRHSTDPVPDRPPVVTPPIPPVLPPAPPAPPTSVVQHQSTMPKPRSKPEKFFE